MVLNTLPSILRFTLFEENIYCMYFIYKKEPVEYIVVDASYKCVDLKVCNYGNLFSLKCLALHTYFINILLLHYILQAALTIQ